MPQVPVIEAPRVALAPLPVTVQHPAEGGVVAYRAGEAIQRGADAFGQIALDIQNQENVATVLKTETDLKDAYIQWSRQAEQRQGFNATGLTSDAEKWWEDNGRKATESLGNDAQRRAFVERLDPMRQASIQQWSRYELGQRNAATVESTEASNIAARNVAIESKGDPAVVEASTVQIRAATRTLAALHGWDDQTANVYAAGHISAMHAGVIDGLVEKSLPAARAYYEKHQADIHGTDRDNIEHALQAEQRRLEAEARARAAEARQMLRENEQDAIAAAQLGMPVKLPPRAAYVAAFGSDGAARYDNLNRTIHVYGIVNEAVGLPPAEAQARLEALKPTSQEGAADAAAIYHHAVGLYVEQRTAFEKDPAQALVARDPATRALFEKAVSPKATADDWKAYAARVSSAQEAAGIPKPRLLPAGVAANIGASLAFDPAKPEERVKRLQSLQQQFGTLYPLVIGEVAPSLDGTAKVLVGMAPERGARLDAALAAGGQAKLTKLVPDGTNDKVRSTLTSELLPLANTLKDNTDFEAIYGQHYDAAYTLALSLVARGEDPSKAAKQAAADVINDQFDYRGTIRIPKGQPTDAIIAGAERIRTQAAMNGTFRIAASSYSSDEAAQAELRSAIEKGGYWITNTDQSGLVLMVPTKRGASQVLHPDGTPVTYTWGELTQTEAGARAASGIPGYINPQSPTFQYLSTHQ